LSGGDWMTHLGAAVGIGVIEGMAFAPGLPIGDIPGTAVLPGKAGLGVPGMFGLVLPGTRGGLLPGRLGLLPGTRGGLLPGTLGLLGLVVPGFVVVCPTRTENAATHTATIPKYFICFIRPLS